MNYHYAWEFGRHSDLIVGWLHRVNFFYFFFYGPLIKEVTGTGLKLGFHVVFWGTMPRLEGI